MKHLQTLWNESSAQIAKAKTEAQSHEAELERLRQAQLELCRYISELEVTIDEAQKERAFRLRAGLRETASIFADRSRFYAALESEDLFDAKVIKEDKEAIDFYESAKTEATKIALQSPYEKALRNQEERKRATSLKPIDAGVVLHQKGEQKLDIYLTALTGSVGGLANNLTRTVRDTVQASRVYFAENNVEDLLRITINGDYRGLVQELEKIKPEGFKEAQVEYQVVVLGEDAIVKPKKKRKIYDVIEVDEIPPSYIVIDEAAQRAGFSKTNFYRYMEHDEVEGNKFKKKSSAGKPKMYINMNSLEKFLKSRDNRTEEKQRTDVMQNLSPLSVEPLSGQNGEAAYTAEMEVEEELKCIVQTPGTLEGREAVQQLSQAQIILGDEIFVKYVASYNTSKVGEIVGMVSSALGEERAKLLFAADQKGSLFREQGLPRYLGRLVGVLSDIDKKYGADVPSELSFEGIPNSFFPANLSAMERRVEEEASTKPKSLPSTEILDKISITPELAKRLQDEGYHPVYVHAMLTEGFDLGREHPLIGERYAPRRHWQHNFRRALDSLGVTSIDERVISYHERRFKGSGLFNIKAKAGSQPLAFSPKWAEKTIGALRDYLSSVFPKR